MRNLRNKFTKISMGLLATSMLTFGGILPVSAAEIQPQIENSVGIVQQEKCQQNASVKNYPAAQFTYTEDGTKILTV